MRATRTTAAVIAAAVLGTPLAAGALSPVPELKELTAEAFGEAYQRNAFGTEAALKGQVFRFVGVPMAVTRWANGRPRVTYAVTSGAGRVQAEMVEGTEAAAAAIVPGEPLALVCTGAADGMLFPVVTGCRPVAP